jgi:putative transposase
MASFDYRGPYAYHVVLLTQARATHFRGGPPVGYCVELLRQTAERLGFRLLAFCFMPDHLHVLAMGRHDEANLISFIQRFKQVTAFRFKRETGQRLWQQSFYDRVLRVEENLSDVAAYILRNPVRSGLVASPEDYPLSGSQHLEADGAKAPSLLERRVVASTSGGTSG